ncbi:MAG: DPP IV N-terminal domain-containing protein [Deltaproteobacteria bacterium]|nr:DPP IV N-terminal domain-containing protein [Deltaproteobacteria bacterium]
MRIKPFIVTGILLLLLLASNPVRMLQAQSGLEYQEPSVLIPVDLMGGFNRYNLVIPSFLPIAASGSLGEDAGRLQKRLSTNLDMTGYFQLLDPRSSLESNPRAGLAPETPIDYAPWAQIGANFVIKGAIEQRGSRLTLELRLFDISTGTQLLAKRYTGPVKDARKMINRFTNEVLLVITGERGVFGSQIIFLSDSSVMMTELGADEAEGVSGSRAGNAFFPTIGYGGRTAWTRQNGNKWELVADGKVVYSGELVIAPAFSPSGVLAAGFSGPSSTNIAVFENRTPRVITRGGNLEISPTFSPDGSRMAYVSDQGGSAGIYIAPASGGTGQRLSPPGKSTDPSWSPKGDKIAFVLRERDICVINADGSGLVQLTSGQGVNRHPSFSPDGRMIVFHTSRGGKNQLYVMAANGDRQQPLIPEFTGTQTLPTWSPEMPEM